MTIELFFPQLLIDQFNLTIDNNLIKYYNFFREIKQSILPNSTKKFSEQTIHILFNIFDDYANAGFAES